MQRYALVANGQLVGSAPGGAVRAVVEGLGPDVCQSMVYKSFAPIGREERVEGEDVRIDSGLQEGVGTVIGGRVAEEVFAAQGVVLVIPLGGCSCWSHVGLGVLDF